MSTRFWYLEHSVRIIAALAMLALISTPARAQAQAEEDDTPATSEPAEQDVPAADPAANSGEQLALAQEQVTAKYRRFEEVLLRMAELTAPTDPKRAALLRKAVGQSKERLIGVQLEHLVELLSKDRLANAVGGQQEVEKDLTGLLDLLLSEERGERLKDEKERLKEQIRRIKEMINKQQQLQGQTAGGTGDPKDLARGQGKLAEDAGKLADEMKDEEQATDQEESDQENPKEGKPGEGKPGEGKPGKGKPGEGKPGEGKPSEGKPGEGKPSEDKPSNDKPKDSDSNPDGDKPGDKQPSGEPSEDKPKEKPEQTPGEGKPGEGKPGEGKPGDPQPSGEGQPGEGQPQEGESADGRPQGEQQPPSDPARKRVQAAQQKMEQAREKLEKAQREGAVPDQEEALRELRKAQAELEEILRQLREEEDARTLAMLEARFRKMLEMQTEVYEGTLRLDRVPEADRGRNGEIEAGRLSRKESLIVVEVDHALVVLREEGSAVAFPEAVSQMREDMEQVAARLSQAKVDKITQTTEEDIIAALEEMIAALQKAQKDLEEQKQQPSQQPGEPQDPPLVDKIAELKMIRALQMRVNNRTERYAKLVEGEVGQADKADLIDALERLGEREQRIFRTTRDIVVGRNQ